MARRMYEFMCPDNHRFERLTDEHERTSVCPQCSQEGKRIISAVHLSAKMGLDPSSAQGDRWARMHTQEAKRRNEQEGNV